jgi:hypothetical protein
MSPSHSKRPAPPLPVFQLIEFPEFHDHNDFYYKGQVGMTRIHVQSPPKYIHPNLADGGQNMLIRGLNSIHSQLSIPNSNEEKRTFADYVLCWCVMVHEHHETVLPL